MLYLLLIGKILPGHALVLGKKDHNMFNKVDLQNPCAPHFNLKILDSQFNAEHRNNCSGRN